MTKGARMSARRSSTLVITLLAAAGLSACGSSSKSTSTATTQSVPAQVTSVASASAGSSIEPAFIARVNALCTKADAEIAPKGKFPYANFNPTSPNVSLLPKVAAYFESLRPVLDRVPAALQTLGTPKQGSAPWAEIVALVPRYRVIADRQITAAKASDARAFANTVSEISTVQEKITRVALDAGFSATSPCTELF
jgi:hypothetical protein